VPEALFDLGEADLAGQAQVFVAVPGREFRHRRNSLTAGIAGPNAISLHTPMVTYGKTRLRC
jgi:hypothetical protein